MREPPFIFGHRRLWLGVQVPKIVPLWHAHRRSSIICADDYHFAQETKTWKTSKVFNQDIQKTNTFGYYYSRRTLSVYRQ